MGLKITLASTFVAVLILVALYPRYAQVGVYRNAYEGTIVDKSQTFHESRLGSSVEQQLVIRDSSGNTFSVVVSHDLYERASVGMWIKKNGEQVDLLWPGPRPSPTVMSR